MRDLTDRALDTASARRRIRRRPHRPAARGTIAIKTGRVEGVASGETEGFGVRVLVDGAWGFAIVPRPDRRRGGPGRRRSGPHRPGERHGAPRPDAPRRAAAGQRPLRDAGRGGPFAVPLETKIGDLLAADEAAAGSRASRSPSRATPPSASGRRSPPPTAASPSRSSPTSGRRRGERRRRRRAPAPELPRFRRRLGRRRLRDRPRPRPGRARRAARRRRRWSC